MEIGTYSPHAPVAFSTEHQYYLQELNALYPDCENGEGLSVFSKEKHSTRTNGESLTQFAV